MWKKSRKTKRILKQEPSTMWNRIKNLRSIYLNKESSTKESTISISKDIPRVVFDAFFYGLGFLAFYNSLSFAVGGVVVVLVIFQWTGYYSKDPYSYYLDSFIDFLNQVNSGLSSGLSFDSSVLQSKYALKETSAYMKTVVDRLGRAIQLGINGDSLFEELESSYPIDDVHLYTAMMKLGKTTGASMNHITEITLSGLYTRFRTVSEARLIVYQKQFEQMVLCIAPLLVIFFIRLTSGAFLAPLYTTGIGFLVMTISFSLLVVMKLVGRKIVEGIK